MVHLKLISGCLIFLVTVIAGLYPFCKKQEMLACLSHELDFPIGESLAAGIFLGAGLMHMLADSVQNFYQLHVEYPVAFLLAGAVFLLLLWLEHVGREIYQHEGDRGNTFAVLATIMLSLHSFLAGTALGLSGSLSITLMILVAILAHKWAASLALSIHLNKSQLSLTARVSLFALFACMVPLGIVCGESATHLLTNYPLIEPIFTALAAGTFLYLGTLHGLERAVLVKQCCDLNRYTFVVIGFLVMAVVAIWT